MFELTKGKARVVTITTDRETRKMRGDAGYLPQRKVSLSPNPHDRGGLKRRGKKRMKILSENPRENLALAL
jgi:hypothetical protein